jgi:type III pantothenate kinase
VSVKDKILAIDIGNTSTDFCLFKKGKMTCRSRLETGKGWEPLLKRIRPDRAHIKGIIISSVVPSVVPSLKYLLRKVTQINPFVVGQNIKVPIINRYRRPKQVGQDRLVNAYAGIKNYGGPLLIVDFGTALTFDVVSQKGEYLGGVIMPGLRVWLDGLAERTALLPKITLKGRPKVLALPGRTTYESMQSGVFLGFSDMCDGMVLRIRKKYGQKVRVIACGGQAELCVSYCKEISYVDSSLTLKGLYLIYTHKINE